MSQLIVRCSNALFMMVLRNRNSAVRLWGVILVLWTWTASADAGASTTSTGLVGRAGAVQLLEYNKDQAVREVRIVKITGAGTNVTAGTTITGDYGGKLKVGVVQEGKPGATGRFLVSVEVFNCSTVLETDYLFSLDSRENPMEYYAPQTLKLSSSEWIQVYGFKERFPPSELRIEILGGGASTEDGPANGSQPFRSETNRTPSAAGSRR